MTKLTILSCVMLCICAHLSSGSGILPDGQGKRVLVLLDSFGIRETHSTFFKSLRDRAFQLSYKLADDADLTLSKYSEYLYDHVILFCPNVVGKSHCSNTFKSKKSNYKCDMNRIRR